MDYDLVVRGARLIDGSGAPSHVGDVGVRDDLIVEIGRLHGTAARTIDAAGLAVAPGFIDHHTHLDAQLYWDPYGTWEPQHGVTSVVMGNCGLTLAPVHDSSRDALVQSFVRVEAMPRRALEAGVPWGWHTFAGYLESLEGRIGINAGALVGHIALRQYVMGEDSVERAATPDEIERMVTVLRESLVGGALGFSTNRNTRHMREDGKPVASRFATQDELFALTDVLSELNSGVLQPSIGPEPVAYRELAGRIGRPVVGPAVSHHWSRPADWRRQLNEIRETFEAGYRAFAITSSIPFTMRFNLVNSQAFDEFPNWRNVMFLPVDVRKSALADPETRGKLGVELTEPTPKPTIFHRRWDLVEITQVARPENQCFVGRTVAELGELRGQDPFDAFLDLSLEEDLTTEFSTTFTGGDTAAVGELLRSPFTLIGTSDAGAHLEFDAAFGYATTLLGTWVHERGIMTLEQAVHKLTFFVASIYGLRGRGLIRPGYFADLVVFDPATIGTGEKRWAHDLPGDGRRLVQESSGVHYTIVNGRPIYDRGALTGDLPGVVLRGETRVVSRV